MRTNKLGIAMRIGVELCSALIVSLAIGWFIDDSFDTKPLFIIIFFFLGAAAGIMNVFRTAKKIFEQEDD